MAVTNLHPLYAKRQLQWSIIRDCVEGELQIKLKGEKYLPRMSGQTDAQYEAYKTRARWNNYLAQNLSGLHGLIFRRNPVSTSASDELNKSGLLDNIDRRGTNLYQFLSDSVYDAMQTSWGGFLVDMPVAGEMTQLDAEENGIRPYIRYYPAESIINWGYEIINGVEQLAYVVLQESVEDTSKDEFSHNPTTIYRVLDARSGTYCQRVIKEDGKNENGKPVYSESVYPVEINGVVQTQIPFFMFPTKEPEKPMFFDLAMCNIGHYQKTADYENGVHLTTIPTGYVTGYKIQEDDEIRLGHDSFLAFPEAESKVGTLVFSGEGLTHSENAIKNALADMAILGSRLLASEKGVSESADSAKIHRAGENARLATFAKNISEIITKALKVVSAWSGFNTDIRIELCTDYDTLAFDPNALNALANLSSNGKLPMPYVYYNLKNGEYLPPETTFKEFAAMMQVEIAGLSPIEIVEVYNRIQAGEYDTSLLPSENNNNKITVPVEDIDE